MLLEACKAELHALMHSWFVTCIVSDSSGASIPCCLMYEHPEVELNPDVS